MPIPLRKNLKIFSSLKNKNFRYFYLGQGVSLLGTSTRTMAMGWLAFQLTNSPFQLGLVYAFNTLPILLLSLYAGSVADRFPKLTVFKITSGVGFISSSLLAVLIFTGKPDYGVLLLFALLWGTAMAFEMPSRQSLMVELVGPKNLVNAISLNSAMVNASRIVGPALGGPLLALFGAGWCFLLDALSFLVVLWALYRIRVPAKAPTPRPTDRMAYLWEGAHFIGGKPILLRALLLLLLMSVGGWAYQSQLAAFVRLQLGLAEWGYVWILASAGLGSCLAALMVASRGIRLIKESTLYTGIGIYALFMVLFGMQQQPLLAAMEIFAAAFGVTLFFSTTNSLLQSNSPQRLRGRVMGLWAMVFGGGMPIGSFLLGTLADQVGPGKALQMAGFFCLVISSGLYFVKRDQGSTRKR